MENITTFLNTAENYNYLLIKVVLVFGLNGACRKAELCHLLLDDIEDSESILVITLHDTKTKKCRIFTVTNELNGYELYQEYIRF